MAQVFQRAIEGESMSIQEYFQAHPLMVPAFCAAGTLISAAVVLIVIACFEAGEDK
jgi:hypothetical protein